LTSPAGLAVYDDRDPLGSFFSFKATEKAALEETARMLILYHHHRNLLRKHFHCVIAFATGSIPAEIRSHKIVGNP
jgi:hypothetical protein